MMSELKYEDNLIFPNGYYVWLMGEIKFPIFIYKYEMIVLN